MDRARTSCGRTCKLTRHLRESVSCKQDFCDTARMTYYWGRGGGGHRASAWTRSGQPENFGSVCRRRAVLASRISTRTKRHPAKWWLMGGGARWLVQHSLGVDDGEMVAAMLSWMSYPRDAGSEKAQGNSLVNLGQSNVCRGTLDQVSE